MCRENSFENEKYKNELETAAQIEHPARKALCKYGGIRGGSDII